MNGFEPLKECIFQYTDAGQSAVLWNQQIVRCKDCFWFNENATPNDKDYPHFCHKLGIDLKDGNGFCAWSHKEGA